MVKKAPRDPGAPKRNMSAYLLYQNAMRETFKAQNPGMTFGQLAKYTSAMYAELPPEEKDAWVSRAESDKARYLQELATYVPPPGYDAKGDAIASFQGAAKGGRRSGKSERDPNAPKRSLSSYLLYQNAMRDQFRAENPGMTFGQLAKYTSAMYKCLTPEEKASWDSRAVQDKIRYEAEMKGYVPPPGHDAQGNLLEDHRSTRKVKKAKDPNAPKRARGSFVFFTFDMRPQIMKEFPGIKFVEMGTVMGERWRALSEEEKTKYEDLAAEDKIRFNAEMQKYMADKEQQEQQQQQQLGALSSMGAAVGGQQAHHHPMASAQQLTHQQQQQTMLNMQAQHDAIYGQQLVGQNVGGAQPNMTQYASDPSLMYNHQAAYDQSYQYQS